MNTSLVLSDSDRNLLVEMLCCIVAADRKVSGNEIQCIADTLAAIGCDLPEDQLKTLVVDYCRVIHKHTPITYLDMSLPRFQASSTSTVRKAISSATERLMAVDGQVSDEERQVADRLTAALAVATPSKSTSEPKTANDRAPWKVAVAIATVYPYGLWLLANHADLSRKKVWWACAIAYPFVVGICGATGDSPSHSARTSNEGGWSKRERQEVEEWERQHPEKVKTIMREVREKQEREKRMFGKP